MIYHYKLSTKLEIINWKNKVRYLVAKMVGSQSSKSDGEVCSQRFAIQPQQRKVYTYFSVNKIISNELFSLISLPFTQKKLRQVHTTSEGIKRKVSLCDTPPLALYSSDNINPNIQKKTKEVLKHLSKKQNKNMSLKQLAVTCLSKFDREMLLSRSEIQLQQQQVFKALTFMVKSFTLGVS